MVPRFALLFLCFLLFRDIHSSKLHFDANLDGNQQNPTVTTLAEGLGSFTYDTDSQKFSWEVSFNFVDSGITMAHIHGPAEVGENAGHLIDFEVKVGETEGTIKDSGDITKDYGDIFSKGLAYVNVHSNAHPDGEIRGQILTTSKYFHADIRGSEQVPAVLTTHEGHACFTFNQATSELKYQIGHDVEDADAIHIHGPAREGENAAPIIIFDETKDSFSGTVTLTEEQVQYLRSGQLYVNIHSPEHPDGEIRGQIKIDEDGNGASDDDWWKVGLICVAIVGGITILSVAAIFIYIKKGDAIRSALSSNKTQIVQSNLVQDIGVSNEPLLNPQRD